MHHVILGAGPAGVTAAETIRKYDPAATITLIGGEPEPPYSRMAIPYYLEGKINEDGTHLRPDPAHYDTLAITYRQGRATNLDTAAKSITVKSAAGGREDTLSYDRLLIATGATPIRPPIEGIDQQGVHTCWTLDDGRHIARLAGPDRPVVLIGAGFIGSIILEALVKTGVNLTVIETGDRMVPRMLDDTAGAMLKDWCEAKGIKVLTGATVTRITSDAGPPPAGSSPASAGAAKKPGLLGRLFGRGKQVADTPPDATPSSAPTELSVTLESGESLPAALVVIATGVKANIDFLSTSGLDTGAGVKVDNHLATSAPDVFAAGDIAEAKDLSTGGFNVLAVQPVAVEHGLIAGLNMTGRETTHRGSLNMNVLDTIGLISTSFGSWMGVEGGERATLHDAANWRYIRLEFEGDKLIGAQTVGQTEHIGMLRGLIQTGLPLGGWKDKLMRAPERFAEAYVAASRGL